MDEEERTSTKVALPKFSGVHKDFVVWWMRFTAFAAVMGFTQSIQQTKDPDLPAKEDDKVDDSTDAGKKQKKAIRANAVAMANLTMAFVTEQLLGLCHRAKDDDWPVTGLAYKIVVALFKKYMPKDLLSKVELRRELAAVSMAKEEDPENMFEKIAALENKYNTATFQISSEDKIATIIEKAPKEYQTALVWNSASKAVP